MIKTYFFGEAYYVKKVFEEIATDIKTFSAFCAILLSQREKTQKWVMHSNGKENPNERKFRRKKEIPWMKVVSRKGRLPHVRME